MNHSSSKSTKSWTEARAKVRLPAVLDRSVALERLVLAVVLLLTVWGIWSFGIWDPWELDVADAARALSEPGRSPSAQVRLSTRLVATAFDFFGVHDWSGRLPGVLAALLSCSLTFLLLRKPYGRRAAVVGVAVLASTPLFLLNARLLMGNSLEVFAQTWVGVATVAAASSSPGSPRTPARYLVLAIGLALSSYASGVLLGPLPPLLAAATLLLLSDDTAKGNRLARWLLPTTAVILVLGVLRAVSLDDSGFSVWLGGGAVGGDPATFDRALELVFHGFAPWSVALPVAGACALAPRASRSEDAQRLAWLLLLWFAYSFVSWTVFASRYGTPPYLGVVPLAGLVAIWMTELSEDRIARWPTAVIVSLLMGLLVRDYALYPDSPLRALAADGLNVPDVYRPAPYWALLLSGAALILCIMLVSPEGSPRPRAANTVRWIRTQWSGALAQRAWLLLGGLLLATCFVFGAMCFLFDLHIPSLALRIGRALFLVPLVLAGLVFGLPWLRYAYGRLGRQALFPALGGGLLVGGFLTLCFQPALSQHLSPKPVFDAYTALTGGEPEPLASYKMPSTAASYYSNAAVEEVKRPADLVAFLGGGGQRWAVMQAESLPAINSAYRRSTGEHLYVADAQSARLLLVAANPIEGRPNQSFIADAVLSDEPQIQHRVGANYDGRVELIGYDLELPGGDAVGAGQSFSVTWYWRLTGKAPAGYQVFVHIDGFGSRLNGDHVPVGGRYPSRLWEQGDVIADTQELTVPANYRVGDYAMYVGMFSGSTRLPVKSGADEDENRVNAGVLRVR